MGRCLVTPEQPAHSLHHGPDAIDGGPDVEEEDGVALFVFRCRVVVDDVPHLCLRAVRVRWDGTMHDPVVSIEWRLRAERFKRQYRRHGKARRKVDTCLNFEGKNFPAIRCNVAFGDSFPGRPWNLAS